MEDQAITTGSSAAEQRLKVGVGSTGGKSTKHVKLRSIVRKGKKKDGKGGPGIPSPLLPQGLGASPMGGASAPSPLPMGGSYSPLGQMSGMTPPQGASSIGSMLQGGGAPLPMGGTSTASKPMMAPPIANKPHNKKGLGKIVRPKSAKMKKLKSILGKGKKSPKFVL